MIQPGPAFAILERALDPVTLTLHLRQAL